MARKKTKSAVTSSTQPRRARDRDTTDSPRTRRQRQYRLSIGGNTRSQKTLTQINFVARPSNCQSLSDLDLEYIEEDENEQDGLTPRTAMRTRKQKKLHGAKGAQSMEATDTTLTQIGYVTLQKSNEDNTGVQSPTKPVVCTPDRTRKRFFSELDAITEEAEHHNDSDFEQDYGRRHKKRKLNRAPKDNSVKESVVQDEASSHLILFESNDRPGGLSRQIPRSFTSRGQDITQASGKGDVNHAGPPVTPRKPRRRVVPSSQSPESPELMLSSLNRTHIPIRSPLRSKAGNLVSHSIPESHSCNSPSPKRKSVSPESARADFSLAPPIGTVLESHNPLILHENCQPVGEQTHPSSPIPSMHSPETPSVSFLNEIQFKPKTNAPQSASSSSTHSRRIMQQIVYETDNESNADELYDTISQPIGQHGEVPIEPIVRDSLPQLSAFGLNSGSMENAQNTSTESEPDASLLYTRHHLTYPHEKYMGMLCKDNTAQVSQSNVETQSEFMEPSLPAAPHPTHKTSSQEDPKLADDLSTESIPESPQGLQNDVEIQNTPPPPSPIPVVLVESSQSPTNAIDSDHIEQQDCEIVTESQLLPESLMESIPTPPGWMSSLAIDDEDSSGP
ncbi:hypothetical protein PRK78_004165 [Emydomyces testavorans]|uniref:Uncharacterized protein n=1 Tax=Emydomyces testavorans TaxID=2070801 RepID=A0AAF0DHK8_9EURO|nr:hypothetical protein PRK78_004165 [Emydomyces testavorans]